LCGLALGSILCARLVASAFGPTPVSWDAASCAAGTYTVTATATRLSSSGTYVVTADNVKLPQFVFSVEFPILPPGEYSVVATGRTRHGRPFESGPQTVSGLGSWTPEGTRGHQTSFAPPSTASATATAALVQPSASSTQQTGSAQATQRLAADEAPAAATAPAVATAPPMPTRAADESWSIDDWLSLIDQHVAAFLDAGVRHYRIELLDTDADGIVDAASVELSSADGWTRILVLLSR